MSKFKGKGVVIAGLLVGAASFLSKKENRDKTMSYIGQLKKEANGSINIQQKVDEFFKAAQGNEHTKGTNSTEDEKIAGFMAMSPNAKEKPEKETLEDIATTAAQPTDSVLEGNHMIDEGAQTTVNHFNEEQQDEQGRR
ncbi:MAG: 3-oxoacyl-ACP reductase [Solibacillus sp.]